ncbi:MAG: TolC family protein [Acinetobacter populi]|jgi:outer membrane protein TolC|uniref:TolC family protein n=1 Tax=Acinetobacter populi TaxID=1582270 RepID=UPI002356E9C7|nr:TolC family protein [Acinetobacter populi]MCH4247543.1 TolC family protein [Acinetobacter populi]
MFIEEKKQQHRPNLQHRLPTLLGLCIGLLIYPAAYAQEYSYAQAEQQILQHSYTAQANTALQQAAQLEAEAVKGLGLPRIDLNARAYKFHSQTDVPLDNFKQSIEDQLSQRLSDRMSELENIGVPSDILDPVESGINNIIHDGIGQLPNYANLTLDDEVFRPTISMTMPIYTGGLTQSAKQVTQINARRSALSTTQQQDVQRFELVQSYFYTQLQQQLLLASQENLNAMQRHLDNAIKFEQQGFISKGQRMQFNVARNNAARLFQTTQSNYAASYFQLKNLLQDENISALSTPLFVNKTQSHQLDSLLASFADQSPLIQKLRMDTELANEKVKVQSASQKPKIFAFGEYGLDDKHNWIVGVVASYNLFSGINKSKQVQAAELQRYATELLTERTKQEMSNIIYKAYSELQDSQQSHQLLMENMLAAQENLRIQTLSFQEDMGTATQVIDAENMIHTLKSEIALNAYKYVMSLATLLQSNGSITQFKTYVQQNNTDYIGN